MRARRCRASRIRHRRSFVLAGVAIVIAVILLGAVAARIAQQVELLQWWVPLVFIGGHRGRRLCVGRGPLGRRYLGPRRSAGDRAAVARAVSRASPEPGRLPPAPLPRHERRRGGSDDSCSCRAHGHPARQRVGARRRRRRIRMLCARRNDEPDSPVGAHARRRRRLRGPCRPQVCCCGRREHARHHRGPYDTQVLHHDRMVQPPARSHAILPAARKRRHPSLGSRAAGRRTQSGRASSPAPRSVAQDV